MSCTVKETSHLNLTKFNQQLGIALAYARAWALNIADLMYKRTVRVVLAAANDQLTADPAKPPVPEQVEHLQRE